METATIRYEHGCRRVRLRDKTSTEAVTITAWHHQRLCNRSQARAVVLTFDPGEISIKCPKNWEFLCSAFNAND